MIIQVKRSTYKARARILKGLTVSLGPEVKTYTDTPKSLGLRSSRVKPVSMCVDYSPPRTEYLDRTMTNLSQRPDTSWLIKAKPKRARSPRPQSKKTGNIHMEAMRAKGKQKFIRGSTLVNKISTADSPSRLESEQAYAIVKSYTSKPSKSVGT
jgi:hypothetical protein